MLQLQGVHYAHPNKDNLFSDIDLSIASQDKIALIGNNGAGKSTLLKLMAGLLTPAAGVVRADTRPYYIPQLAGQYNGLTVAQALQAGEKLRALQAILNGDVTEENMITLNDDWTIEARCREAFEYWQLPFNDLDRSMDSLSGGQKTRVLLAGIQVNLPGLVLLDEPSNHLDAQSRQLLYRYIESTNDTLVVVSHDRTLLNLLPTVYELSKRGITIYGGSYDFYVEQKAIEQHALTQDVKAKEKALRKAREVERGTIERQQKLDARGKKKKEKAGTPTIMMNTLRNNAEKSTARIKDQHAEKTSGMVKELDELRASLPDADKMKMNLDDSGLHKGKILVTAKGVRAPHVQWPQPIDCVIRSGERIAIKGPNGSGKTTFIKLMLGEWKASEGVIERADFKYVYIDQDYSLINEALTVYEQAQQFNTGALQEHEIKIRLHRFLFDKNDWDKRCSALSGGEKMRLILCCLTIGTQAPDLIVLDEPTNNLDLQNVAILTAAINEYTGTLLVVSHDEVFLKEIGVYIYQKFIINPEL